MDDDRPSTQAFDESIGTLQQAIRRRILPALFFAPAPEAPPPAPDRTLKALVPAPPGYQVRFVPPQWQFDHGTVYTPDGEEGVYGYEDQDVLSFAVMENRDGTKFVDAVVQRTAHTGKHREF